MSEHDLSPAEKLYAGVQLVRPLLRNITSRVEADLAGTGISVGQRAILEVLLVAEQATAPEITKILQVKRQFVARELKELTQNVMVETVENPGHRRSVFYRLSEKSRKIISEIRRRETVQFTEFANKFTPAEIDAFFRVQKALNDALSEKTAS